MVVRDEDSEVADAIWYSEFLKECGIVQYTAEFRNCGIHYLTDCEGYDLVCVDITLFNGKETLAISPLLFMSFGYGVKSDKPKLSLVKFN